MQSVTKSSRYLMVYLVAAIISVLLSCWASVKEVVLNPDAICYLQSAETVKMSLSAAMHVCDQAKWPFYSILISVLSNGAHISSFYAASILNACFSLISVLAFMGIIQFLAKSSKGNSIRIVGLAAVVILFAHQFDSVRVYIIRDHGFWAFYLTSIFLLLHYFQKPRWFVAIAWNLSLIAATLFRIEGMLFLLFLPFLAWVDIRQSWLSRLKSFLQLNFFILLAVLLLAVWVFRHSEQVMSNLGRVSEVEFQVSHGFDLAIQHFTRSAASLAHHVLSPYAAGDAVWILFLMLVVWYLVSVATNVSWVYAVLIMYAWGRRLLTTSRQSHRVLWSYIFVNVVITTMFLAENMFLSKRYLLALSLVLMVWVPFALEGLVSQWKNKRWPLCLAIFFMLISSISGMFDFGHSKLYIRQAGDWLAEHSPKNESIYSNDYQVLYYSRHFDNAIFAKAAEYSNLDVISNGKWKQYDYVALRFNKDELAKNSSILKEMGSSPIKVFSNKRGDQVSVYRIPH